MGYRWRAKQSWVVQFLGGVGEGVRWGRHRGVEFTRVSLDGGEWGTGDALGSFHHPLQCFLVRHKAVAIPNCDTVGNDSLDGAAVEVHQNLRRRMDLLWSPQEEETLVRLLDQSGGAEGPWEVLGNVHTQKLEAGDTLNLCSVDTDGGGVPFAELQFLVLLHGLLFFSPRGWCLVETMKPHKEIKYKVSV